MWIHEDNNGLLYFISNNFAYRESVAITAFNHTLIDDTIKKEKIPLMNLYNDNVITFLEQINEHGSIIIIENSHNTIDTLKSTIGQFFSLIDNESRNIPFMIFFSLKNNRFKKPYTNIFKKIQDIYSKHSMENSTNENLEISLDNSIVIGNNAGRLQSSIFKKDLSDCDRAFASNIGISNFRTPNQVFANDSTQRQWKWSNDVIKSILDKQRLIIEPSFNDILGNFDIKDIKDIKSNEQQTEQTQKLIVFISGAPTSGKTLMGNRIKGYLSDDTVIFDINNYASVNTMKDSIAHELDQQYLKNIIIINTLESPSKRYSYFSLLENRDIAQYQIKYIEMIVDRNVCEFLNLFRLQLTNSPILTLYKKSNYTDYYSNYKSISSQKISEKILHRLKYIKFPLLIRDRKEIFYHF